MPSNVGYGSAVNAAVETLPDEIDWVLIANPDRSHADGKPLLNISARKHKTRQSFGSERVSFRGTN